jgi:hypothetical protein
MAITINAPGQNAGGDAILANMESGTLRIYSAASAPANAKAAEGTAIAEGTLTAAGFDAHAGDDGADMAAAVELTGLAAAGSGTDAHHFRYISTGGTPVVIQGTVTGTGGGGDLTLDNINIAEAQVVNATAFTFTLPDGT